MDTIEYATFRYDTVEVENGLKAWFSYVADGRRVIVGNHSRRKFTKDFTHEQSPTIVVADVGDI